MNKIIGLTIALVFLCLGPISNAQTIVPTDSDCRLLSDPSGARNDNNGGNTITGALIGVNTGGVENYMVYEFSDLSALAGQTIVSATVEIDVMIGFSHPQHGSDQDVINLSEIALSNAGWDSGMGEITGSDTPADDGSISFLNRVQYNGGGTTEPWLDSGGTGVANLLGALTPLTSIPAWNSGSAPDSAIFTIDPATAQSWVDNGLGGLVMSATDDGDSRSRFNMRVDQARIVFETAGDVVSVTPESFTVSNGTYFSGGITELAESDNADLSARRSNSDIVARVNIEFKAVSSIETPSSFDFTLESSVFARTNVVQSIDLFDYVAGSWEEVDMQNAARFSDSVVTVSAGGDLSRFVEAGTGCVEARVRYLSDNPRQSYSTNVDQVIWDISN